MSEANLCMKIFLLCGNIAAGKSTLSRRLAHENRALFISQEDWLATLYSDDIHSLEDYRKCSSRLCEIIGLQRAGRPSRRRFGRAGFPSKYDQESPVDAIDLRGSEHEMDVTARARR